MAAARDAYLGHRPDETENGARASDDSAACSGDEGMSLPEAADGRAKTPATPQKIS